MNTNLVLTAMFDLINPVQCIHHSSKEINRLLKGPQWLCLKNYTTTNDKFRQMLFFGWELKLPPRVRGEYPIIFILRPYKTWGSNHTIAGENKSKNLGNHLQS